MNKYMSVSCFVTTNVWMTGRGQLIFVIYTIMLLSRMFKSFWKRLLWCKKFDIRFAI